MGPPRGTWRRREVAWAPDLESSRSRLFKPQSPEHPPQRDGEEPDSTSPRIARDRWKGPLIRVQRAPPPPPPPAPNSRRLCSRPHLAAAPEPNGEEASPRRSATHNAERPRRAGRVPGRYAPDPEADPKRVENGQPSQPLQGSGFSRRGPEGLGGPSARGAQASRPHGVTGMLTQKDNRSQTATAGSRSVMGVANAAR